MLTYVDNNKNIVPLKDGDSVYIGFGAQDTTPGIIYKTLLGPVLAPVSFSNGKTAILQDESFFGRNMTIAKITKDDNIIPA